MITYTIETKRLDGSWDFRSEIYLLDHTVRAKLEDDIRTEMLEYGDIAVRCRIVEDDITSYIFPIRSRS